MVTTIVNLSLPIGDPNRIITIQGYQAESYSETPSQPNFDSIDIGGRSSPIAFYNGGSARTVSFSMLFHRDMVAPWTSACYGGMPSGIDADGSQYAGMYLGESNNGYTTEQQRERYIADYLKFNSSRTINNDGFTENNKITYSNGKFYDNKSQYYQDTENTSVFNFGDKSVIVTYEQDGDSKIVTGLKTVNTKKSKKSYRVSYDRAYNDSNLTAEADATARFHLFLNRLKALNYPVYNTNGIIPPKIYLKIGGDENNLGGIRLKGYCSVSVNYDGLVKHNSLISTSVDFQFTEVVDIAWSAGEIINGMERYTKYMDPTTDPTYDGTIR